MRLACIEAFLSLAEQPVASKPLPRASLRRLRASGESTAGSSPPSTDRVIASAVAILLVAALFFALHAAMLPAGVDALVPDAPIMISFVRLPPPVAPPPLPVTPKDVSRPPARTPPVAVSAPRALTRDRAIRAVIVPAPAAAPVKPEAPLALFAPDGSVQLPPPPVAARPRDLLAHQSVQRLLPHGYIANRGGMAMDTRSGAMKATQFVGNLFGGSGYDPCPDLRQQMVDMNDRAQADAAAERYENSCEGR